MRFPLSVKPFRGQLDMAAFAGVFMLLLLFVLLASLVYTPGVNVTLPFAPDLPGTDRPTIAVAVDSSGRYYFQNQLIAERDLRARLREAATNSASPPTLVVLMDQEARHRMFLHLATLARKAGINDTLLATSPEPSATRPVPSP